MPRVRKMPRNSINDRPAGWWLMLRRQRRLLRPAAYVAAGSVVLVLIGGAFRAAPSHTASLSALTGFQARIGAVTASLGLRVTDIRVEGQSNTPEPLLWSAIDIKKGDPILGFSLETLRRNIEQIPWIEKATIERRLPGTVVINLQERRPFAIWQTQGKFLLVDRAGQVVTEQDVSVFHHLPLIVGQGAPGAAAQLLDALRDRPAIADKVEAAVHVADRRWNLRMKTGTDVLLPEGHEIAALDRLLQLEQEHSVLDRPLAAIDLRLPDRLVFRPKPDAKGTAVPTVPVIAKKPT